MPKNISIKYFSNYLFKKKLLKSFAIFLLLLFSGYGIGRSIGIHILSGVIKGSRSFIIFYRLPFELMYTGILLSSGDELKRLEGYYSLLDNKIIDTDLLIERYKEESGFIKPTIIWLLGYSGDKDKVLKFLAGEYDKADQRIKTETLKTMKRLDESYFLNFTGSRKINTTGF